MAYQEYVVTSLAEVPNLFAQFADSLGWTVTYGAEPTFRRPDDVTAVNWRIRYIAVSAVDLRVSVDAPNEAEPMRVDIQAPRLGPMSGSNHYVPQPTKLHMLGGFDAEPWLAAIVEFGFNSYRHLYVGYMEKIGNYSGGEVISSTGYPPYYTSNPNNFLAPAYNEDYDVKYLFTWYQRHHDATISGGVRINHPDNPNPYRTFYLQTNTTTPGRPTWETQSVIGGFRDGLNDGYLARGNSSFAGASILVPINLYAPIAGNWLVPIGKPAGVRMVNMRDIEPGASVTLATDTWKCFPALRKTTYTGRPPFAPPSSGSFYAPAEETSYLVGYAYQEASEDEQVPEE